jgi:hypothetical protein
MIARITPARKKHKQIQDFKTLFMDSNAALS